MASLWSFLPFLLLLLLLMMLLLKMSLVLMSDGYGQGLDRVTDGYVVVLSSSASASTWHAASTELVGKERGYQGYHHNQDNPS